jgi:divalent metal cation (Fe/Co/Zn/Cd) transporter
VKGKEELWSAIRTSKNPAIFVVLFEDFAALGGLVIAPLGIFLGHAFQNPYFDGIASILIGVLLSSVAIFLAYESRKLLLGESAGKQIVRDIRSIAEQDPDVVKVKQPYTMHFGPNQILLNLSIQFEKGLNGGELARTVDRLEKRIQKEYPEVKHIFIEAESITKTRPFENGKQAKSEN